MTGASKPANSLWGGRFAGGPAEIMRRINASIDFDKRLYAEDIAGSKAHCAMLVAQNILSPEDGAAITAGLEQIRSEIESGSFVFSAENEDIHMNIEARLAELIGPAAGRLHTARSRNDQVATDLRLWVRGAIDRLDVAMRDLQQALIDRAEAEAGTVMPGYTHLQIAQPVTLGHHLMAYVEMIGRDRGRLADCRRRLNECPLGAAALAGTSFPIDRHATAAALGFDRPAANSLDAVSDRDFAIEFLAAAALAGMHLSRFAEEIVIWCSDEFGFIALSDAFTTGSSIMPQKRNPDAAELVRAKTGRLNGSLIALLTVMKGLPLAYRQGYAGGQGPGVRGRRRARALPRGDDRHGARHAARPRAPARRGRARLRTATDLADWLVRVAGLPFRRAHHVTGEIVKRAEALGCTLAELPLAELQAVEPAITAAVYDVLDADRSVASRTSFGGTAPERVRAAAAKRARGFWNEVAGPYRALSRHAGIASSAPRGRARARPCVYGSPLCPGSRWRWRGAARGMRRTRRRMSPTPFRGPIRVSDFFPYRDGELHAEEVPVSRIAAAVGTPFYLYSGGRRSPRNTGALPTRSCPSGR